MTKQSGRQHQRLSGILSGGSAILLLLLLTAAAPTALAGTVTWTGATNTDFELGTNWSGNVAPAPTDDVAFGPAAPPANLPALTVSRSVNSVKFLTPAGGWTLGGAFTLTVAAGVSTAGQTSGTNTISCGITLGASQTWLVGAGGTLAVSGVVGSSGAFVLTVGDATNTGTLVLSAANTYSGATTISGGTLSALATSSKNPFGASTVNVAGGTLSITPTATLVSGVNSKYIGNGGSNSVTQLDYGSAAIGGSPATQNVGTSAPTTAFNFNSGGAFYPGGPTGSFGVEWTGMLTIAGAGNYTFYSNTDDGSRLYVDNILVIDNDGPHGMQTGTSAAIALSAGLHHVRLQMANGGGGYGEIFSYNGPDTGNVMVSVPFAVLSVVDAINLGNAVTVSTGAQNIQLVGSSFTNVGFGTLTLNGGATLNVTGDAAKTLNFSGTALVNSNATMTINAGLNVATGVINDGGNTNVILSKTGAAALIADNTASANTMGGTTFNVQAGRLIARGCTSAASGTNNPLGAGAVRISGGTLALDTKCGGPTFANNVNVTASGSIEVWNDTQTTTLSGTVTIAAGQILTVNTYGGSPQVTGGDLNITGQVSGAGGLIKANTNIGWGNNPGRLYLSNNGNNYSGLTTINAGPVIITANGALGTSTGAADGTVVNAQGELWLQNNITSAETITLNGTGWTAGNGGGGALRNDSGNNTLSASVTLASGVTTYSNGGTLTISAPLALANGLVVDGPSTTNISGLLSGASALTKNGTGTLQLSNAGSTATGNFTINTGTLQANGGNNVPNSLTGALGNPQTAGRTITVNPGATLQFASHDVFGNAASTPQIAITINGGTVNNNGAQFNALGPITLNNGGTLTGTGGANASFQMYYLTGTVSVTGTSASTISGSGSFSGIHLRAPTVFNVADVTGNSNIDLVISGTLIDQTGTQNAPGSLTKIGPGTLALTGASSYTSSTNINQGAMLVNGTLGVGSSVDVNNTGILGGTGTVNGPVSVAAGGAVSPGSPDTSPGVLTVGSPVTFVAGSTYTVQLNSGFSGVGYDQLNVTGAVNLNGCNLNRTFNLPGASSFTLIHTTGGVTGQFNGLSEGATLSFNGRTYSITYQANGGNDVVLGAVAQTFTWTGGGATNNWTEAANWGGTAPMGGDNLVFGAALAARKTNTNDFAAGVTFNSITFTDSGYTLSGNNFGLSGGATALASNIAGANTINPNITFGTAAPTITCIAGGTLNLTGSVDNGGLALTLASAGSTTINGAISGAGGVLKTGAGTLTLAGAGTYSGSTVISAGTLKLSQSLPTPGLYEGSFGSGGAIDTTTPNPNTTIRMTTTQANTTAGWGGNQTWVYTGYVNNPNAFSVTWTFGENVDDVSWLKIDGNVLLNDGTWNNPTIATYTLTPGRHPFEARFYNGGGGAGFVSSSWWTPGAPVFGFGYDNLGRGQTVIGNYQSMTDPGDGSLFSINLAGAPVLPSSTTVAIASGATLDLNGSVQTLAGLTDSGGGGGSVTNGSATGTKLTIYAASGSSTFSGVIQDGAGAVALTKDGASTQILAGSNTYSGATTITAGVLALGADNVLPDGAGKAAVTVNATLDMAGHSDTINGLTGTGTVDTSVGTATLTVGGGDATSTFNGILKNTGGVLNFGKTGAGTQTLLGNNTYSGTTLVSAGTLRAGAVPPSGSVLWLDATDSSTMTKDAQNRIAQWRDKLGGANNVAQATGSRQPIQFPGLYNGLPMVRFNSNLQTYLSNTTNFVAPTSVVFVGRMLGSANFRLVASNGNNWLMGHHGGYQNRAYYEGWVYGEPPGAPQTVTTNLGMFEATIGGGGINSTFYRDGTLLASNQNGVQGPNGFELGGWNTTNEVSDADIGEVFIYNRVLSNADRLQLEAYLNTRWFGAATNTLPDGSNVTVSAGATLDLAWANETIGSLAGGGNVVLGGTTVTNGNNSSTAFSGVLSGYGSLVKSGTGTLTLNGTAAQTTTGTITVSAGTLQVGDGGNDGNLGSADVVNNSALVFNVGTPGNLAYNGGVSGTGSVSMIGSGTVTLGGASTYTGATTISNGTLRLAAPQPPSGYAVHFGFESGAAVNDGNGLANYDGTLNAGASIVNGGRGVGSKVLNIANGNQSLILNQNFQSVTGYWTGSLWFNGLYPSGTWRTLFRGQDLPSAMGDHNVIIQDSSWNLGWYSNSTPGYAAFQQASPAVSLANYQSGWHQLTAVARGTATDFYIDGVYAGTSPGASVRNIKYIGNHSTGTQPFAAYLDDVYLYPRALSASEVQQLYLSTVLPPNTPLQIAATGTLDLNGVNQTVGSIADSAGAGGQVINNAVGTAARLTLKSDLGTFAFSGVLKNGTSTTALLKDGLYTQVLSGANTFTGGTTVSSGTLKNGAADTLPVAGIATINANGIYDLGGFAQTVSSISGNSTAARITTSSGAATLTIADGGGNMFGGALTGALSLVKNGTGAQLLGGNSTYTGSTTINAGTLRLGACPPTAIAGLPAIWLDGSDMSTLYQDAAGTTPVTASGQPLGLWKDKSGNNNHYSQGTAGNRPTVVGGAARFNQAAPSYMQMSPATPTTYSVAFFANNPTSFALLDGIWGASNPNDYGIRMATATSWMNGNAGGNGNDFTNGAGGAIYINGAAGNTFAGAHVLTQFRGAGNLGNWVTTGLGAYWNVTNRPYGGDIAEALIFTAPLTAAQQQAVENYLVAKWVNHSLQNVLPATTPIALAAGATLDLGGVNQTIASLSGAGGQVANASAFGGATLTISTAAGSTTFSGMIADAGASSPISLVKSGSSTQIFTAINNISGTATVSGGTLTLAQAGALPGISALSLASGGTLSIDNTGIGAYPDRLPNCAVTFNGGNIAMNAPNAINCAETVGQINFNSGANAISLSAASSGNCQLITNQAAPARSGGATLAFSRSASGTGTSNFAYTGGAAGAVSWATVNGAPATYDGDLPAKAGLIAASTASYFITQNNGNWETPATWSGGVVPPAGSDVIIRHAVKLATNAGADASETVNSLWFDGSIVSTGAPGTTTPSLSGVTTPATLTINTGSIIVSDPAAPTISVLVNLNGSGALITQNSNTGEFLISNIVSNSASLTKAGPGVLSLSGANTYGGGTTLSGGTLKVGADNNLGAAAPLTFSGATLRTIASFGFAGGRTVTLNASGGTFAPDAPTTLTIGQTISGPGALTMAGVGKLSFANTNTYAGGTIVNNGTLEIVAGGNNVASALPPQKPVTINGGASVLRLGVGDALGWFTGNPSMITVNGGKVTVAAGVHDSVSSFTLNGGTIDAEGPGDGTGNYIFDGSITVIPGSQSTISAQTIYLRGGPVAGPVSFNVPRGSAAADLVVSAVLTNNGINKNNDGVMVLTGANTYSTTVINAGTLQVGNAGTSGTMGGGAVTNNGALVFNRTDAAPAVGVSIGGTGTLTQAGSGTTILTGANNYSGVTVVNAGTLQIGNAGTAGTLGTGAVATNGSLVFNRTDTITLANTISGTGSLAQNGSGTVILTANNSYAATTIGAGTLQIGNGGTSGSLGTGAVTDNGVLVFNRSDSITVGNVISGSGSLTKNGPATLTLLGNNTYGATTISSGTLQVGNAGATGALGTGAITNNGALIFNRTDAALVVPGAISGTGTLTQAGTGATLLTGNNSYSGLTTINAGTLQIGNGGNSGTLGTANVTNNGTLVFNRDYIQVDNVISGAGRLQQTGTGVLGLNGANTYAGTTTVFGGGIQIGIGGTTGQLGQGAIINDGYLDFFRSDSVTVSQLISGSGDVFHDGSSTLTLNANNTYTGVTGVGNAPLMINGSQPASNVVLHNTSVLGGTGQTGTIYPMDSATVSIGNPMNAPGIMRSQNLDLSLAAAATFAVQINGFTPGSQYDQLQVTGTAILTNCSLSATFGGPVAPAVGVPIAIITTTAGVSGTFNGLPEGSTVTLSGRTFQISYLGNNVTLTHVPQTFTWTGGGLDANWTTAANWQGGVAPAAGDNLIFGAGGALQKATCNNSYAADTAFGSIQFNDSGYTINGFSVKLIGGASALNNNIAGANTLNIDVKFANAGGTIATLAGGTLTMNGALNNGGLPLTFASAGSTLVNGAISGAGDFIKTGAGTLTLGATCTYGGATIVNAGTVTCRGPWTPLPGSALWLDGSDSASITQAAGLVAQWNDKSGNNRNATAAGGARPTFLTNALVNGKSVVRFDGVNSIMDVDLSFLANSPYTIIAVEARADGGNQRYYLGTRNGATNSGLHIGYRNDTAFTLAQYANDLDTPVPNFAGQVFRLWTGRLDTAGGGGHSVFLNGTSVATNANTTPLNAALGAGCVGAGFGGLAGFAYSGDLAEILIYNSALSPANRQTVENYLNQKWLNPPAILPSTTAVQVAAGATLDLNGTANTVASLADSGVGGGSIVNNSTLPTTLTVSSAAGSTAFSGVISNGGSSVSFVKNGASTQILAGNNTYTGTTTIGGGTLQVGNGGASGAMGSGAVTDNATLVFNRSDAVTIGNLIGGTGGVNQIGANVLTLSANNTYTGPTQASAGTLLINGAQASSGAVVNGGTLGGTGTTGAISATASGGTLNAGSPAAGPGILNTNGLALNSASTLSVNLASSTTPGTGYDQIRVTGAVSLAGNLNIVPGFSPAMGDSFTIIDNDGADSVSGTFAGLPEGAHIAATYNFQISYVGGTGNDVVLRRAQGQVLVALSSAQNPSCSGSNVTFTSTVIVPPSSTGVPTGTVQFTVDGVNTGAPVALSPLLRATTLLNLPLGDHVVGAIYSGDAEFQTTAAPLLTQSVRANTAPTISPIGNVALTQGNLLNVTAVGHDTDPAAPFNTLTYSLTAAPPWVSINSTSGTIVGIAPVNGGGNVTVQVTDGGGLSASTSFTITVTNLNQTPALAAILNQSIAQGAALNLQAVGSDPDPLPPNGSLTYSLVTAPAWMSIAPLTGLMTGTAANNGSGIVTVRVSDGGTPSLSAQITFTMTVTDANDAPYLDTIPDMTMLQGQWITLQAVGHDVDPAAPNNTFTYSKSAGLAWVNVGPTGIITGQAANNGTGTVTVRVTDGGTPPLFGETTFTITVTDVNDPPTLAAIGNPAPLNQGQAFSLQAVGGDPDPAAPNNLIVYSLTTAPAWLSIDAAGLITGTAANQGSGTVTVRVTDKGTPALYTERTFTVTVVDTNDAPTLDPISNVTLTQGQTLNIQAYGHDADPAAPNNTLTYSLDAAPPWVSINAANGQIVGPANNGGVSNVIVRVTDGALAFATTSFTLTIIDVNDPPTIDPIANQTVLQGASLVVSAAGHDIDPAIPNNTLTYSLIAAPSWLTIDVNTGAFIGAAPNGGSGVVTVRVSDGGTPSLSAETTFSITVTDTNEAPVVAGISDVTIPQNNWLAIQAVANDPDPAPNNVFTFSKTSGPAWVSISPDGLITGKAANNGSGTVVVTATDTGGLSGSATFDITVVDVNDPPTLAPIPNQPLTQGDVVSITATVVDNDPTPSFSAVTFSLPVAPSWLTIDFNTGVISGVAANNGGGVVIVRAVDGGGLYAETMFTVTVADLNDAPTIDPISDLTVTQGQSIRIQAMGHDVDPTAPNNTISYSKTAGPLWVNVDAAGLITGQAANNGSGLVTVTVTDGVGATASVSFNITVTDVNDAPTLPLFGNLVLAQGAPLVLSAGGVDIDPAAPNNKLTYSLVMAPSWVTLGANTGVFGGNAANNGSGTVIVRVTDAGTPPLYAERTFTITVTDANDAPTLDTISDVTLLQGAQLNIQATGHDIDPAAPNNTLTYSLTTAPAWVTINAVSGAIVGTAANNGGGTVTVRVTDGGTPKLFVETSFLITVTNVNDAPVINNIANVAITSGNPLLGLNATATDIDAIDTLTFTKVDGPAWVSVATGGAITGTAVNGGSGAVTVRVTDLAGASDQTTFNITVTDVNTAPTIQPFSNVAVNQATLLYVQARGHDADPPGPNSTLTYVLVAAPPWLVIDPVTGTITGVAPIDGTGSGIVTVHVTDGGGLSSVDESFTVTVNNLNDPPRIAPLNTVTLAQNTNLNALATATDPDLGQSLVFVKADGPAWVNVAADGTITGVAANNGSGVVTVRVSDGTATDETSFVVNVTDVNDPPTLTLLPNMAVVQGQWLLTQAFGHDIDPNSPNNSLTYSKVAGVPWVNVDPSGMISGLAPNNGSGTLTVSVTDGAGAFVQQMFTITVIDVNDPPVIAAIPDVVVVQNANLNVTATATDIDTGDVLTFAKVSGPAWISVAANGAVTGVAPNAGGGDVTVKVTDNGGLVDQTSFHVTVTDVNDGPTLDPIPPINLAQGAMLSLQAVGHDIDPAAPNNTMTYSMTIGPSWVVVGASGSISGQAPNNGSGSLTVRVTDGGGLYAEQTVAITIADVNDAPTLDPISDVTVAQDAAMNTQAFGHDIDPAAPNNALTYSLSSAPAWVSINAVSGAISGTAPNGGSGSVTVRVTDGGTPALFAEQTFNVIVTDVNDVPTLDAIASVTLQQGQLLDRVAVGHDIDPAAPNNKLTYKMTSGPSWVTVNPVTGLISGVAVSGGSGTVVVQVSDGASPPQAAQTSFNVTVINLNPAPVISDITPSVSTAGAAGFTLSVSGIGFISTSVVKFGSVALPTTVVGSTQLTAPISAAMVATPGPVFVTVANPTPGGGISNAKVFTINGTPIIISGASATPNPGTVNLDVVLSIAATDPEGKPLAITWDFGDGTSGAGSVVTHRYSAANTYTVVATVTDQYGATITSSLSLLVALPVVAPDSMVDTDGDGFPDALEIAAGSSPTNPLDTPGNAPPVRTPIPLPDAKLRIKLNFATPGGDSLQLNATLVLSELTQVTGQMLTFSIGGLAKSVVLDMKGAFKSGGSSVKLTSKGLGSRTGKLSVKLSKESFSSLLAGSGLTNTAVSNKAVDIPVYILFDNKLFQKTQHQLYTCQPGKSGSSKDAPLH
ncbi:MAG TPA: autotransporter-associated beta strand repeat-containing protein [Planctomycetota bacterium]|jgi:autotransporter-associated beta strand protein